MPIQDEVRDGEDLVLFAHRYKFHATEPIVEANPSVFAARGSDVLNPGEVLTVPDKVPPVFDLVTGHRYVFVRRSLKMVLRFVVEDEDGDPYAGFAYKLELGELLTSGQSTFTGVLGEDGEIEELVPLARVARLTVLDDEGEEVDSFTMQLGALPDMSLVRGIKRRLQNLGYPCDGLDNDEWDEVSMKAAADFLQHQEARWPRNPEEFRMHQGQIESSLRELLARENDPED
jgi:hypothetical protein